MAESDQSLSRLNTADDEVETATEDLLSLIRVNREHAAGVLGNSLAVVLSSSPLKQFGIGFGIGWISGYLFRKVSRTAAILIGGGFLCVQGAIALGLIQVNWGSLKRAARQNMKHVENKFSQIVNTAQGRSATDMVMEFCSQHVYLSSGFTSGLFSGLFGFPL